MDTLKVSAPGRICLLGEHQDYFSLPIIAAAINLRISVRGKKRKDKLFKIDLPDIEKKEEFLPEKEIPYTKERDYLKSSVNNLLRRGIKWSHGWDCLIKSSIPLNSGTASSSALVVAWIKFLLEAAQDKRASSPETIAELAFLSEVSEFREPGGRMDHYSSSLGKLIGIHFGNPLKIKKFKNPLQKFILAESGQKKDTTGVLNCIKTNVLRGVSKIQQKYPRFNLKKPLTQDAQEEIEKLPEVEKRLLKGTLYTKDLTAEAEKLFGQKEFDHFRFGELLNLQYKVMRDYLRISSPKLELMISQALKAGALGAKINGSGEGGCIIVYAPKNTQKVAESLKKLESKVHVIIIDEGVRIDTD